MIIELLEKIKRKLTGNDYVKPNNDYDELPLAFEERTRVVWRNINGSFIETVNDKMNDLSFSNKEIAYYLNRPEDYVDKIMSGEVPFTVKRMVELADILGYEIAIEWNKKND